MRRKPQLLGRIRWAALAVAATFAGVMFVATSGAQAVVVNDNGVTAGVAMVPGTVNTLPAGTVVTQSGTCSDPWLTSDLIYQPNTNPLCYRGGSVIHSNETFAVTWDPAHAYWSGTRGYVEQYLRDVADASGSLSDPYALATQYQDGTGRAGNASKYGGGCIDYGNPNNSSNANTTCLFGSSVQTGPGNNYPASGCPVTGGSYVDSSTPSGDEPNTRCLTDSQLQGEIASVVSQTGMLSHTQPNYTPMVVMLLPASVETCLDSAGNVCSANSSATAQFCAYHSQVNVGGTVIPYVVEPWTPKTACDEPDDDAIPTPVAVDKLATLAGERLVSPISQAEMGAITDPALNGWIAADGSEINDNNGCIPEGNQLDAVSMGHGTYHIQREWDNGAAIAFDPNTYFGCAPDVLLNPTFVVPSAVDPGDAVVFDGSTTASTLIVPNANYVWDFGDGTGAVGPSVVHSYAKGGTFTVTLTVTDRGGNVQTLTEPITVLGSNGFPVPPSNPPTSNKPTNTASNGVLQVRMQLLPQGLRGVIRSGIKVQVVSNGPANGIAIVYITRAMAKRVGIKVGHGKTVTIGEGTVSQIKVGTVVLHLHLSRRTAAKLKHVKHATLNVRLSLVGVTGSQLVTVAAGRY
jgi:PKD domain